MILSWLYSKCWWEENAWMQFLKGGAFEWLCLGFITSVDGKKMLKCNFWKVVHLNDVDFGFITSVDGKEMLECNFWKVVHLNDFDFGFITSVDGKKMLE